ncbi:MAG TPA: glycosyl transferase [Microscillaceae bacterium]|jgi:heptosyltransferase-2|nr:glycosyl transferase [Microscillaceae bacterium]
MKILVLRFSSIGDIILTTPVVRCLKTQLPQAEVHYCTKDSFRFLVQSNPYIDKIHTLQSSIGDLAQILKKEQFDWVIDLHHNLRTLRLKWALGAPSKSFNKLNWEKWLFVNFKIDRLPRVHIVDRYLETVKHLGVRNDDKGLDYFIPAPDQVPLVELPPTHRQKFVAFAIGGGHPTKKLPLAKMIELCAYVQQPIVLLGGAEDAPVGDALVQYFEAQQATGKIYNACGRLNFNQSVSLLQQAHVVLTHDTGLMHAAAALKKKIYSIWGNTVPEYGMYPYQTDFEVIENKKLSCRSCSKIGFDSCPKGHFRCMNDLVFDFDQNNW